MDIGLFDGEGGGEHNGVGLVQISKIFAMQDDFVSMRCCCLTASARELVG